MTLVHKKITVFGKVQGVFFRISSRKKAKELGVNGFVKNQNDGSVYAEVEGDRHCVNSFVEWCKSGPEKAIVDGINVENGEINRFTGFEIRK